MMQPVTVARVRPAEQVACCSRSTAIGTGGLRVPLLVPTRQVLARFREGPSDAPKSDTDTHRSSRGPPPAAPAPGAATTPTEKAGFMGADHPAVPDAPKRTFATPEEAIAAYSPSSAAGRQTSAPAAPPTSPNAPQTPSKETPADPKAPTNGSGASKAAHQDAASVAAAASTITVPRMDPPIPPGTATAPAAEPAPAKQQPQQQGSSLPAMDLPGPYDMPAVHHVPVNPLFSFGCSVLAAGWWALAATSVVMTGNVLQTLFPAAVAQTGGRLMVCLWGASMLPLAAATLSLKDATDAGMCGTPPADQLTLGALLGCALPLVVTLQAVSLRHMPLTVVVGGLSLLGVVLSSWLAAQVHPWKLPLPNIKEAFKGVLSLLTPRTWQAAVFGVLSVLMLGGAAKLAMVGPHTPNLLMAGPTVPVQPQMAGSLAVFVSRAAAGSLMAAGVVCLVLKEAADRKLLASRFASRMATALGLAAAVAASQLGTSLVIRVAAAHPLLLAAEVVLLATAAFAGATAVWPIKVQALQLVPAAAGEPSTAPKDARLQVAQQLTTPEVLAVMAAPYDPGL